MPDPVNGGVAFQSTPPSTSEWQKTMERRAQQAAIRQDGSCDGTDRHLLGMSTRAKVTVVGVTLAIMLVVIALRQFPHLGVYAIGLLLGAVLSAGYSVKVDGDTLVVRGLGTKRVDLSSVNRVELYTYRGATSLRLWRFDGKRVGSLPTSSRFARLSPPAAAHLRRWLDRPDVTWGPGAWEVLIYAGVSGALSPGPVVTSPRQPDGTQRTSASGPRGKQIAAKPRSRWSKALGWFSVAAFGIGTIVLVVLAPIMWSNYMESQRIQHGPEVSAIVHAQWTTNYSDRSGTHYDTHFDMTFHTLGGEQVATEVSVHGTYPAVPEGDRLFIRYDPGDPNKAELPDAPNNTFGPALVITIVAITLTGTWIVALMGFRRAHRRRKRTHGDE